MPLPLPTTTLEEFINAEQHLTVNAPERLGSIVDISQQGLAILNTSIIRINERQDLIAPFMLSIQKSMTLAFLSYIRSHTVQAELNCRQAIELTTLGAYFLANQDVSALDHTDPENPKFKKFKRLSCKANKWLERIEPKLSELLEKIKRSINENTAHGNTYVTQLTIDLNNPTDDGEYFTGSLFDNFSINDIRAYLVQFCELVTLIIETMRRANEQSQGIVFKDSLRSELAIYARAIDIYRSALGEIMQQEQD